MGKKKKNALERLYADGYEKEMQDKQEKLDKLNAEKGEKLEKAEKTKKRSEKEQKALMNRLKRIEGQVRGVQNMLEKEAYCIDVITQVAAINAALNSFSRELLENHLRSSVANNLRQGNDEVIDELSTLLQKLMK